jgi:hypothetical protein
MTALVSSAHDPSRQAPSPPLPGKRTSVCAWICSPMGPSQAIAPPNTQQTPRYAVPTVRGSPTPRDPSQAIAPPNTQQPTQRHPRMPLYRLRLALLRPHGTQARQYPSKHPANTLDPKPTSFCCATVGGLRPRSSQSWGPLPPVASNVSSKVLGHDALSTVLYASRGV